MTIKLEKLPSRVRNRPLKDYSGERFGRLVAVALVSRDEIWNDHIWSFRCDCGALFDGRIKSVRSGHTSSCGCLARDVIAARNATHGLSKLKPREYRAWKNMRARCRNPSDTDFADYGGRGISIAARWDDFAAFYADMGDCPDGCSIDRIDVNGNYEPSNCRWASAKTQANNKRSNRIVGGTTLQQVADASGIDRSKLRYRLDAGYSLDEAIQPGDLRRAANSRNRDR